LVSRPAIFDHEVPAFNVAGLAQTAPEAGQRVCVGLWRPEVQVSYHWQRRLLRVRRERPCGCRATEERDELASPHSITSSARPSNTSGIVKPSALAVLRLMTNSNFVGCCTGRSAAFSPLRMRAANRPACR